MTKKTAIDPVFAEYTRTAPLEDLRFYLRYAERRLMTLELSESTVTIVREMIALEREVLGGVPTPAAKARVWALIPRFRASIPGWAGSAGERGGWVEPVDSDDTYWRARRALTMTDIIEPAPEPLPVVETPGKRARKKAPEAPAPEPPEPIVRSVEAEGPVTVEQVVAWRQPASDKAARLSGFGVPRRAEPLTLDAVRALLAEGVPEQPVAEVKKPARARQQPAVVAALACPTCSAALVATGATWACDPCRAVWSLQPVRQPAARPVRAPRRVAPVLDGEKTCIRCNATQPLAEFAWAAPQARNVCLTCRRVQRRDAITRRQQAA